MSDDSFEKTLKGNEIIEALRTEVESLNNAVKTATQSIAELCDENADLTQQLAAANGRASSWWAALMEAAGCLEQAAMSMRDEDAKRAALGAAEHARNDAHRLAAIQVKSEDARDDRYCQCDEPLDFVRSCGNCGKRFEPYVAAISAQEEKA